MKKVLYLGEDYLRGLIEKLQKPEPLKSLYIKTENLEAFPETMGEFLSSLSANPYLEEITFDRCLITLRIKENLVNSYFSDIPIIEALAESDGDNLKKITIVSKHWMPFPKEANEKLKEALKNLFDKRYIESLDLSKSGLNFKDIEEVEGSRLLSNKIADFSPPKGSPEVKLTGLDPIEEKEEEEKG